MEKKLFVIKVGTSSLTERDGSLDESKVKKIADGASSLKREGHSVIIVTSGSIAAGFKSLGFSSRPSKIPAKQACASVGQGLIMDAYSRSFAACGYTAAQILLTPDVFSDKKKYENAFNTLEILLLRGAVPVINENDTVATAELKIGDNDTLSAQVAAMVHADRLVLLTDTDGLYTANPKKDKNAKRLDVINEITPEIEEYARGAGSANGTGGMKTKLSAASLAVKAGVEVIIASSAPENAVYLAAKGKDGTLFPAKGSLKTRLQWVAFYAECTGAVEIDEGAQKAIKNKKSLLAAGITRVSGDFEKGAIVKIVCDGKETAKGKTSFSSEEIKWFIQEGGARKPVIHIDNMVIENE